MTPAEMWTSIKQCSGACRSFEMMPQQDVASTAADALAQLVDISNGVLASKICEDATLLGFVKGVRGLPPCPSRTAHRRHTPDTHVRHRCPRGEPSTSLRSGVTCTLLALATFAVSWKMPWFSEASRIRRLGGSVRRPSIGLELACGHHL